DNVSDAFHRGMGGSEPGEQVPEAMMEHKNSTKLSAKERKALESYLSEAANNGPHWDDEEYDTHKKEHLKSHGHDPDYVYEGNKPMQPGDFDDEGYNTDLGRAVRQYIPELHQGYIDHPENRPAVASALKKLGHEGMREAMNTIAT